jgi:hypothetical protein
MPGPAFLTAVFDMRKDQWLVWRTAITRSPAPKVAAATNDFRVAAA